MHSNVKTPQPLQRQITCEFLSTARTPPLAEPQRAQQQQQQQNFAATEAGAGLRSLTSSSCTSKVLQDVYYLLPGIN